MTPVEKIVILELPKFKKYKDKTQNQELRQKYIMDQKAIEDAGYDKGYDSGTLDGEKKKSIEIAKKLKSKKIDIEDIVEITGLTKEEIEKL